MDVSRYTYMGRIFQSTMIIAKASKNFVLNIQLLILILEHLSERNILQRLYEDETTTCTTCIINVHLSYVNTHFKYQV